jgi:hypothetical protein
MRQKSEFSAWLVILIAVSTLAAPMAMAQNAAPPSLKEQLEAQYRTSKIFTDGSVKDPGTVLVIQQNGVEGVPLTDAAMPTASCKEGTLHKPGAGSKFSSSLLSGMTNPNSDGSAQQPRPFPVGDKVYISNLNVNLKRDRITFTVAECAACNGSDSAYKAAVSFEFAKGSLATTSVPDVEDAIAKVFTIDNSAAQAPPAQLQAPPQQAPVTQSAPAPAPPASIQLGQTIDQVVAALGQPEKTVNLGAKQIYVYKDLKVTFLDGKVSDVQ